MKNFIKAQDSNGEMVYINLNLVEKIIDTEKTYILSLLGNTFFVDKENDVIASLINP